MSASDEPALSHLDAHGHARMVDVSAKAETVREAVAEATVVMQPATAALIAREGLPKGDVLAVARVAGLQAAKRTWELIPLCHPLALTGAEVAFDLDVPGGRLHITATVRVTGRTGVEMEALTAASVAALAVYDMAKAVDRGMEVTGVKLVRKAGGRSGTWTREGA